MDRSLAQHRPTTISSDGSGRWRPGGDCNSSGLFLFRGQRKPVKIIQPPMRDFDNPRTKASHPYAWLWEPLENDPTFVLKSMFGAKAAYLDGKLQLCFMARKEDPWRGVLVGTSHEHHGSLIEEFPSLAPHSVLPKWLYLSETEDDFEATAQRLVTLVGRRDPRIGVEGSTKRKQAGGRKSKK